MSNSTMLNTALISAYLLADKPNVVADTTKVFQSRHNVKPIKRRHYLLEQSSARNLSTVVHPPNPQTAHSFKLCLSTSKKTPIAWIT